MHQYPSRWANYRICEHCSGRFTVDDDTKRRQIIAGVVAFVSLVLTLLMYYRSTIWLAPAIVSYAILAAVIYYGNSRVYLVPFEATPVDGASRDKHD